MKEEGEFEEQVRCDVSVESAPLSLSHQSDHEDGINKVEMLSYQSDAVTLSQSDTSVVSFFPNHSAFSCSKKERE